MAPTELLSQWALFGWGCLGGFAAALLTLTTPWLFEILDDDTAGWPGLRKATKAAALLAVHTFFGGLAAVIIGGEATVARQAILFGMLWPTAFKSAGEAGKEIIRRRVSDGDDPPSPPDLTDQS